MTSSPGELSQASVQEFQHAILSWYDTFKRELPWRGDPDPYHILVSEIMLQQTQAGRMSSTPSAGIGWS